jgi:hypothetical protein
MAETDPLPASSLQFDTAEYAGGQPAASACSACKEPIVESYYTVNGAIVCDQCRCQIEAFASGGSRLRRAFAATAWGLLAGLAGAVIWFAVRRITGYEIGLIAIVVGLMVGVAVRKGSRGRGGWFYQTLAVALTYSCITAQYVPDLVEAFVKEFRKSHAAAADPAGQPPAGKPVAQADAKTLGDNVPAEKAAPVAAGKPKPGIVLAILAFGAFLVFAFVISLAVPFLGGADNIIGLLIIGFALYEAWRINKRVLLQVAGPFRLAPSPASGTPDV